MKLFILFLVTTFTIYSNEYNETFIKSLFYYIKIAYCESVDIQDWKCPACDGLVKKSDIQDLKIIDKDANQVFSLYDSSLNKIIISFRGSHNKINWIQNIQVKQEHFQYCDECKVHKGFYDIVKDLQDKLTKDVQYLMNKYPSASIQVTGHSLGGALAYIYAMVLANIIKQTVNLTTFEAPRAFNKDASEYSQTILGEQYRITHNRDIVPAVPLVEMNYYHFGPEVFYNENMDKYQICKEGESYKCSRGQVQTSMDDHTEMGIWGSSECNSHGPKI